MSDKYIQVVLKLANCSPRHLIILLSKIYDEQATLNDARNQFSDESIKKGLDNFAKTFDFATYYAGTNPDTMRKIVGELLRVHKIEFETKDLIEVFKISSQAANRKIQIMLGYGLIEDITAGTRAKQYRLIEPRIAHMISNDLRL